MLKVYTYAGCDTCRKAVKFLQANGPPFHEVPIRETPPTRQELLAMHRAYGGHWRKLFNSSGVDYKALGLAKKLSVLTEPAILHLLTNNGNLVKRPFLIGESLHLIGFKEEEWKIAVEIQQ